MKNSSSGFTNFITISFAFHILASIYLFIYAHNYEVKQKQIEEQQHQEDIAKQEKELEQEIKEIIREVVEEKDEKKKEEIVEELKDKVWEEIKDKKEELLEEKKELDEKEFLEELAKETLKTLEEIKQKELEQEKKKELIDELIAKDLPEIDKKIEEELKDKTVEQLEEEAIKEALKDLKKVTEEEIKPVLEKTNDSFLKKIEDLLKQLADTTKKDDKKSLQEEMKNILAKTDEIINKSAEADKIFEEASEEFKKDQLQTALDVYKDKEQAVNEKKEEVVDALKKMAELDKSKAPEKIPETNKEWDKLIKDASESAMKNDLTKPENQNLAAKPIQELVQKDAEKDKAEKTLKAILKEEIVEAKLASEEVKQQTTSETAKKQITEIQKELTKVEEKSSSSHANEFKQAAESVIGIKETLPEIAKGEFKNSETQAKDNLDVALDAFKESEKAVEKKKEEVLDAIKKVEGEGKAAGNESAKQTSIAAPKTEKEWNKLIQQTKDSTKNPENKKVENNTALSKPLEELVQKDTEKDKLEEKLKAVIKDEIKDAKKASEEFIKTNKTEEAKSKINEVVKEIQSAETKSISSDSKLVKEAAETMQEVKNNLPAIAKATVNKENSHANKDPLVKALDTYKEKEVAVEKKKEEVLEIIKKLNSEDQKKSNSSEKPVAIKAPDSEKEWDKLIKQANESAKNNDNKKSENQSALTKPLESLAQKDAEKDKAEEELKKVIKDEIGSAKKASDNVAKNAKTEETKKQINDVKQKLDVAENKSKSTESKDFKEAAESVEGIKNALPEIAKLENKTNQKLTKETAKADNPKNKSTTDLKVDLGETKELIEEALNKLTEIKTGALPETGSSTESAEKQLAKAEIILKDLALPKPNNSEKPVTPEQIKEPKENISKARNNIEELKLEIGSKEQNIKKEAASLKKNLSEKEKKDLKAELNELESAEKNIEQAKSLEIKIEALSDAESQIDEIKSSVNESRKNSLAKNQEQREKIKGLADEISKALSGESSKKSKEQLVQEIENQAMEELTDKKAESFENFLTENESEDINKQVENFKEDANDTIEQAIKEKSGNKESAESSDKQANEKTGDEEAASEESGDENGEPSDEEKSKGKGKGKGPKGKGKGKGKPASAGTDEENSALAKALASKMTDENKNGKDGKGDKPGEGKEDGEQSLSKNKGGNGQKLDGNSKSPIEIANNILFRTSKHFKKDIVTAEDEKRIFTENINYEAIRVPPIIKFAKPTANGMPLEVREPSAEVFAGKDQKKEKVTETPKNPERPRIKHEKFQKGNFTAIPYLKNRPIIDGKGNDWDLDKAWMKKDKQIAMGWRSDGIYFFTTIRDRTDQFEKAPKDEMFATWWRFDCVELWIDMQNSKSDDTNKFDCQQFTFWPALANIRNTPEIYEILWGKRAGKSSFKERKQPVQSNKDTLVASVEHPDHRGYDMEIFIPHENLLNQDYFKGGQVAGFLYIINHGNLVEDSSLEFYKEGYEGYSSHPSSWGNIQFLGTDAKIEQINKDNKIIKERIIEVSTNLTLQVSDSDSNQNPNVVDKITLRVKNENDFDGVKSENTDWEDLLFTETGKNTGVFTGTITLTVAASKPDDNMLCAHAGDIIHAYYNDHIQAAGEYDEKMHITIKVIAPVQNITGYYHK